MKLNLNTKVMGHPCICFEETDSTNIRAMELAKEGAVHGTLVCAEQQTGGKGRRGRSWSSPPGTSVYMSLLLRPQIQPQNASMLTLVMGLAAAKACNELLEKKLGENVPKVQLKWPNDLVLNGKKIAGILTEMNADMDGIRCVVIGIGINVNTREFPEELAAASSLAREAFCGKSAQNTVSSEKENVFDREFLIGLCMSAFEDCYETFLRTEDLRELRKEYEALLVNIGRTVCVLEPGNEYQGKALGINERGELLVEKENGQAEAVYAGEVSVRGVYGYV